jgi:hypothetical protein
MTSPQHLSSFRSPVDKTFDEANKSQDVALLALHEGVRPHESGRMFAAQLVRGTLVTRCLSIVIAQLGRPSHDKQNRRWSMADLLASVAQFTNLKLYPQPGPFQTKKGFLCGLVDGYLITVAAEKKVGIAVVGSRLSNGHMLKDTLKQNPVLKGLGGSLEIKAADDGFAIVWNKTLKPKPEAIRTAIMEIAKIARQFMAPHTGRCMKCERATTDQLVILGAMPKIVCESCLSKLPEQKMIAQHEYQTMQPRSMRGLAYALATIAGSVLIYGGLMAFLALDGSYSVKLEVIIGLGFAAFCMAAFQAGAGKLTRLGMAFAGLAGAAGKWICSSIFFVSYLAHHYHVPLTLRLMQRVVTDLPELSNNLTGGKILFYIAVGLPLCFVVSPIPEKKFPQFEFVRLGKIETPMRKAQPQVLELAAKI